VNQGLKTTFDLLAATENQAAVNALIPALDAPEPHIQEAALRALLERRSPLGQREVLRRLDRGPRWRQIVGEYRGRMSAALRDAVVGADEQMFSNGCDAILCFAEYDLVPALLTAAEDEQNPNGGRAAQTVLELCELLYQELAAPRDYRNRRDPQLVRQHIVASLETSIRRYQQHKRREVVEACLLLMNRDNATLKQILLDPFHGSYLIVVDLLTHSQRPGVLRLMLSFLDDPSAPSAAMNIVAHRKDPGFIAHLLRKVGYEPAAAVTQNLKRVDHLSWIKDNLAVLDPLDESAQHSAMQLVLATRMKRSDVFQVVEHLLRHGNVGGRRAAIAALAGFNGTEANALALAAIDDPDPRVQATALGQLRQRGIPGALNRLVEMINSPHEVVRDALRETLAEFNCERFMAAFDMLDESVRRSTGALVRKIDPRTVPMLQEEFGSPLRTKRLRAIEITLAVNCAAELEGSLIRLLDDEDHLVRAAAARALGQAGTPAARQALQAALADRSETVQEAAHESLEQLR
jgi:HEAT repeat protein